MAHNAALLTLIIILPTLLIILLPIAFLAYYLESYTNHLKNHAQDSPLVSSLGLSILKKIMTMVDNYFLIRFGLVGWVMDREARDTLKALKREAPECGGFFFYGDSEFTFWPTMAQDIQPWLFDDKEDNAAAAADNDDLSSSSSNGTIVTTRKCVTTTPKTSKSGNEKNNIGLGLDPNVPIFNAGFGGSRTVDVLKEKWLYQLCLDWEPKYVIVHIGMNDYCFREDERSSIREHQYHNIETKDDDSSSRGSRRQCCRQRSMSLLKKRPWSLLDRTLDNLIELLTRIASFESVERVLWYPPSLVGGLEEPRTYEENKFYNDLRVRLQDWIDKRNTSSNLQQKEGDEQQVMTATTTPVEILEFCDDMNAIYADKVHVYCEGHRYNIVNGQPTNYAMDGCHLLHPAKQEVGAKLRRIFYGDYNGNERLTLQEEEEESTEQHEEKKSL